MKRRLPVVVAVVALTLGMASPALAGNKPVPSLVKIKRAIQSTGLSLCLIGGPTGYPQNFWEYATTEDGDCSAAVGTPGGGLFDIVVESTNGAARRDVAQLQGMGLGFTVWTNQSAAVLAVHPLPGTNTALRALGFKRGSS
jgi:hypothetical protein